MLILSNEEIEKVLTMEVCLEALEQAYQQLADGTAVNSPRADILVPTADAQAYYAFKSMAGVVPRARVAALRLNSDILTWPRLGGVQRRVKLPAAPGSRWVGLVLLFSTSTGEPLSIFPDGVLQRMRVGATNGLAAKYLSREDAHIVGLLGSGWQAGAQLLAFCAVRPIQAVRVFSPNPEHCRQFAEEMSRILERPVYPCDTPTGAVQDADILASATNAVEPVIRREWLGKGVHVSCIKKQEATEEIFLHSNLAVLHSLEMIQQENYLPRGEAGAIPETRRGWWSQVTQHELSGKPLYDLAAVVAGKAPRRAGREQITLFMNNIGLGIQFAAVGARIYELAKENGLGKEIPTDWFLQAVHP